MKIGRNEPCPCGSGRKYKRCCLERARTDAVRDPAGEDPVHELVYRLPRLEAAWPALADLADTTEIEVVNRNSTVGNPPTPHGGMAAPLVDSVASHRTG
jgi:hypothetical protein